MRNKHRIGIDIIDKCIPYNIYKNLAGLLILTIIILVLAQLTSATALNDLNVGENHDASPDFIVNTFDPYPWIFARGTDNALWYRTWDGSTWGEWTSAGGIATSDPATYGGGGPTLPAGMTVLARGTDNALWYRDWQGSGGGWDDWENLGGIISSAPAATSYFTFYSSYSWQICEHVFARGTDNALWHKTAKQGTWGNWVSMGGILNSGPGVTTLGNYVYVFARGTDDAIWYRSGQKTGEWPCSNEVWSSWQRLGGIITSDPDASILNIGGTDHVAIFARGTDNALWYRTLDDTVGWTNIGGILNSSPGTSDNMVFVRGADNALWYRMWNDVAWSGWNSLNGIITSGPG